MSHAGDALFAPISWQKKTWEAGDKLHIRKLLEDTDSDLKQEAIASLAQDRSEGRTFVVACSAAE